MPFTPAHAVVALPFVRTPLVPAAIAIGAMTPDLPMFVRGLGLSYGRTHDVRWLPATILVALALVLVWRMLLRPAVRELAPAWLARRLPPGWDAPPPAAFVETFSRRGRPGRADALGAALLLVSLAIGVLSHIAWDAFTHEGRAGAALVPGLEAAWGPFPVYRWLQYGSGIGGLLVIAIWAAMRLRRSAPGALGRRVLPRGIRVAWWLSLPVFLVVAWVGGLALAGPLTAEFTVRHLAYLVLPPACGAWGVLTLVLAIVVIGLRARAPHR